MFNMVTGKDGILSSAIDDNIVLDNLVGDDGMLNRFMGGSENDMGYDTDTEDNSSSDEDNNIKKYEINYILGGKKKKRRKKRKKLKKILLNRCETFDNLYKNQNNLILIKIYSIPEVDLVENIFKVIYIVLFKNILSNLYFNFKKKKKIETINLEYKSIIENNKTLDDSLKTIFFFERDRKLYKKAFPKDHANNVPYQLSNIDVVFSKKPIIYNTKNLN